jgi:hypothetical protein
VALSAGAAEGERFFDYAGAAWKLKSPVDRARMASALTDGAGWKDVLALQG